MKKFLILLFGVLIVFTSFAQSPRIFNQYYRYGTAVAGDSANFATQNLWWYGPNGYRFSENGVKYSIASYIATHSSGGAFWPLGGAADLTGTGTLIHGNQTRYVTLGEDDNSEIAGLEVHAADGTGAKGAGFIFPNGVSFSGQDATGLSNFGFAGNGASFNASANDNAAGDGANLLMNANNGITFAVSKLSDTGIKTVYNESLSTTTNIGVNGFGQRHAYFMTNDGGEGYEMANIDWVYTDVTTNSEDVDYSIKGSSNGALVDFLTIKGGTDNQFSVNGPLKLLEDATPPTASNHEGSLIWTGSEVQYSNGSTWNSISPAVPAYTDYWKTFARTKLLGATTQVYPNAANGNTQDIYFGGNSTYDSVARNINIPFTNTLGMFDPAGNASFSMGTSIWDIQHITGQIRIIGGSGSSLNKITMSPSAMTVTDGRATKVGMEYAADYSTTYTNRSFTDKGYVLGSKTYTGIQTFGSGLASFTGAPTLADGIKWVFNPNGTNAGINVGSNSTLPSAFNVNGDITYTTTGNAMQFRINSQTVKISAKATGTMMLNDIVGITTTGVDPDAGGMKHGRVSTGSIAGVSDAAVTLTWTTPFADTNYTVTCSVQEADADTLTLRFDHIEAVNTGSVVVWIVNTDASAKTGTVHCIAMHD